MGRENAIQNKPEKFHEDVHVLLDYIQTHGVSERRSAFKHETKVEVLSLLRFRTFFVVPGSFPMAAVNETVLTQLVQSLQSVTSRLESLEVRCGFETFRRLFVTCDVVEAHGRRKSGSARQRRI
jgi:hypothetical protein